MLNRSLAAAKVAFLALSTGLACFALLSPARAQTGNPRALVLAADGPVFEADVQAKLQGTGRFSQVDVFDAHLATPTLAQLLPYDSVITWSNEDYFDSTALGNVLADYVDTGRGVVVGVFASCSTNPVRSLEGRWPTGGYPVIGPHASLLDHFNGGPATLGAVALPNHPVMAGVTSFDGGFDSFRPDTSSGAIGSHLIASWSDGKVLAAEHGTLAQRVDLGFFPPSSDAQSSFWHTSTDGARLMANAMVAVAHAGNAGSFCAGDGSGTACPCGNGGAPAHGCASSVSAAGARLGAIGHAQITGDTLTLIGTDMPNSSALYFQGTLRTGGGAGSVFGDGLRCAGGTVVRLGAKTNASGASQYPGIGDPSVSVKGVVTAAGTRTYQVWYRNAAAFCTPSTFNLTNGVDVAWTP